MTRVVAAVALVAGVAGCASTWDVATSKRFRDKPFHVLFGSDDPMTALRENPDGDARARAMRELVEPAVAGRPEAEQEEAVQILAAAAAGDPSPWVRMAAIDALGRFKDPRAAGALTAAYHQAAGAATPQPTGGRQPGLLATDRLGLHGPQGFAPDQVANLRGRSLEALARTNNPDAVAFLARVASGQDLPADEDPTARDFVRQRAVAGLGQVRQPEAVRALAEVLAAEHGKDVTLTHLAHAGLVELTGQSHPADPGKWGEVVQAGFNVTPEPTGIQRAIGFAPQ